VAVDPFAMLELDHRHVEQLLDQLAESEEGPARERALTDLEQSLTLHMQFEEKAVYPLVTREIDAESTTEAQIEHALARDGLQKLRNLASEPGFGAAVEMLKGGIGHHVEEEEREMFPKLRQRTSADVRADLASRLTAAKKQSGLPVISPDATKEQMLELARQLDIGGRSQMSKDELLEAITTSA
jgi:hemerythrin superfamily protein